MKTIETSIEVNTQHQALLQLPDDINPGKHQARIIVDEDQKETMIDFPVISLGGWPKGFTMSRDQLYDDGR